MKDNYKFAIIEDEKYARRNLKQIISKLQPSWNLVFEAESVEDSIAYFTGRPEAELLFLDVELVDGSCFDILKDIDLRIPVIFTTAYDEYALRAFRLNSVDYILKPITTENVAQALEKMESMCNYLPQNYKSLTRNENVGIRNRILTISGDNYSFLPVDEIAWFYSEDKYIEAILKNGCHKMTDFSKLKEVTTQLDNKKFFQPTRNMVISIDAIEKVSKFFAGKLSVQLSAGKEQIRIMVSAARRRDFLDWLGGKCQ